MEMNVTQIMSGNLISLMGMKVPDSKMHITSFQPPSTISYTFLFSFLHFSFLFSFHAVRGIRWEYVYIHWQKRIE